MPGIKEAIEMRRNVEDIDSHKEYAVLLGRNVINTMVEALGEDQAKKFLVAHKEFDKVLEKNKEIDLFELVPVHTSIGFKDFKQYMTVLNGVASKLKHVQSDAARAVMKALSALISAGSPTTAEVSAAEKTRFADGMFRGTSLPAVPLSMQDRSKLPGSYPNYEQVKNVVVSRFNKSYFRPKLYEDLNACTRTSLNALALHRKYAEGVEADPREYLAEAQQYLMDHNFVQYGMEPKKLATAAAALATAGIPTVVDHDAGTLIVASAQTQAYAFLGTNLESVLRTTILALAKDVLANYTFEGRQAATDVVIAASSDVIQEAARLWLEKLQDAFNKASA